MFIEIYRNVYGHRRYINQPKAHSEGRRYPTGRRPEINFINELYQDNRTKSPDRDWEAPSEKDTSYTWRSAELSNDESDEVTISAGVRRSRKSQSTKPNQAIRYP